MLNVNQYSQHHVARERYRRSVTKAWFVDLWGRIHGDSTDLVRFEEVAQPLQVRQQIPRGIRAVPLDQIVGSVGRVHDFTRTFLPRLRVEEERWVGIAAAFETMQPLPVVELYQIGAVYFVRDGHHRISVARVQGMGEIEANVVEFVSPVGLQAKDFQQNCWLNVLEKRIKEQTMFVIDGELAKHQYEERLRRAEQERYAQQVLANRPDRFAPLRARLGDLLINCGTRLKAQPQQEFV